MFDVSSCLIISIRKTTIFHNLAPRFDSNHPLSDFENEPSDRKGPWLFKVLFLFRNFTYFMERERRSNPNNPRIGEQARGSPWALERERERTVCSLILLLSLYIYLLYIFYIYFILISCAVAVSSSSWGCVEAQRCRFIRISRNLYVLNNIDSLTLYIIVNRTNCRFVSILIIFVWNDSLNKLFWYNINKFYIKFLHESHFVFIN